MTENERALTEILTKIVNRANRPRPSGDTVIMVQAVPAALIDAARDLLKTVSERG